MEPRWLTVARTLIGVREAPGPANDNRIMAWAKDVARFLGAPYTADSIPWCGLFVCRVLVAAGIQPAKVSLRAKAWATWGKACLPQLGAILVFERQGGGHVGFYVEETAGPDGAYQVLGGNQGDAVSLAWISKKRCIAVRWPADLPASGRAVVVAPTAAALSRNEA